MNEHSTTWMPRRRLIALVCTAAALLLGGCQSAKPASTASPATSHSVKISLKEYAIYFEDGPKPDGPPILAKEAGLFTGSLGSGVNSTEVRVIAGKGSREFFTRHGSIYGTFVFTENRKPDRDTFVGTLTITGGSDKYAGAHGKLSITGIHDHKTDYSTEDLSGTLTY